MPIVSFFLCVISFFCNIHFLSFLLQRVKVYRLNDDGKWDDQGTGHVTVDYLEVTITGKTSKDLVPLLSLGKNLRYEYPHI